jgi:DNA modification methylase
LKKEEDRLQSVKEKSKLSKEEWRAYTKSVWTIANVSHEIHPAMFPPEIPKRLIRLFSLYGETVFDPFCGVGTTGIVALQNGRRFIGCDINPQYVAIARKSLLKLGQTDFDVRTRDCLAPRVVTNASVDLIITSPPYWNKADYGNSKKNLGSISNYGHFLANMRIAFGRCFEALKPGRRMCVITANVNQYTQDGLLTFPLAADYISICGKLGFRLVNEIVWSKDGTGGKWGSYGKQRPIFGSYPYPPNFYFKNVHEYILIFRKPDGVLKSARVPTYDGLTHWSKRR